MTKPRTRTDEQARLDPTAWTDAALERLAAEGIAGVRVEVLAKQLGVTKGSFYWHFKDRRDLHEKMLEHWRRRTTIGLIDRLNRQEDDPEARLRRLLRLPLTGRRSAQAGDVELAIRIWGKHDELARRTLEEVDELRLRYFEGLLRDCGVPESEVAARAIMAYSYMRVAFTLMKEDVENLMRTCEAILLAKD